jgi:hypothetical protein
MAGIELQAEVPAAKLAEKARQALYRIGALAQAIDDAGEPLMGGSEVLEPYRKAHLDAAARIIHHSEMIAEIAEESADLRERVEMLCGRLETIGREVN